MELSQQNLDPSLRLLGDLLGARKVTGFWLVVCGGSALLAQKIISRATQDVDILALRDWDGGVECAFPLPKALQEAATAVALELGLASNWLNSSASNHFPDLRRLPASFWKDLETREYGDHLRVSFVGRAGQIQLKLYAALNRAKPRDIEDLHSLSPSKAETEYAVTWALKNFPTLSDRSRLPNILALLGHDVLISKFQG